VTGGGPDGRPFRWSAVVLVAVLPTLLFSIGQGAILPVLPAIAGSVGATLAVAGLIGAALMIGELIGDIPSGVVVAKIGERNAMLGATALAVVGTVIAMAATEPIVLGFGGLGLGIATATFALGGHAMLTTFVPIRYRARSMSALGGTLRFGWFVGPFLAAGAIELTGWTGVVFVIQLVACALTVLALLVFGSPEKAFGLREPVPATGAVEVRTEALGLVATLRERRDVLLTLGVGAMMMMGLRASRAIVLPLWAVSIGLDETATSLIVGLAGLFDFSLFLAGGWAMDRFGRMRTIIPAALGLGAGHLILAFTHDLPAAVAWFTAVTMFLSIANGFSAGMLMTLGSDLAGPRDPAPFLGAWRFTIDVGGAVTPLFVAGVTAVASISLAVGALGMMGIVSAIIMRVFIPRKLGRR